MEQHLASHVPEEHLAFDAEDDGGDPAHILEIRVRAETIEEASSQTRYFVGAARYAAGLPAAEVRILGYASPSWGSRSQVLSVEATKLHKQKRHELAVVRIQTVCEMHIAEAIRRLTRRHHREVDHAHLTRRSTSLTDRQSLAVLQLLTGRRVQDETWWPNYTAHVKRRNEIIHQGLQIAWEDAKASFEATMDLEKWLLDVQEAVLDLPELGEDDTPDT